MARRASWKGRLTFGEESCGVALYSALESAERISFNIINRKTGHRVERRYVDSETGAEVARDAQIKGYPLDDDTYVAVEPDELAELMPKGDKTLAVDGFLGCGDFDRLYLDKPYFLGPAEPQDDATLTAFAETLARNDMAAIADAVMFRRNRKLVIRVSEGRLIATTLHFDYEVRPAKAAFRNLPDLKFDQEMLDLAAHIIDTRAGSFKPQTFVDQYDEALHELVEAKIAGKPLPKRPLPKQENVVDLRDALRRSASLADGGKTATKRKKAG